MGWRREEEAWARSEEQRRLRIGRTSRSYCLSRLERELSEAFQQCGSPGDGSQRRIPKERLAVVLEKLGFLCGEAEESFCAKLALLLDKDYTGYVFFDSLFSFLSRVLDREDQPDCRPEHMSLEEECYFDLERQLSKAFCKFQAHRLSRPKERQRTETTCRDSTHSPRSTSPARTDWRHSTQTPRSSSSGGPHSSHSTPRCVARSARRVLSETSCRGGSRGEVLSRNEVLFHQAALVARHNAELEEEGKIVKMQEEMRECTFAPKITSTRRCLPTNQPRNFDRAVARMRSAHRRRQERREEFERIPCGENYDRLRRLKTAPFSCYYDKGSARAPALLFVDVNVGHGKSGRIGVHEGDDFRELAVNFGKAFQLDRNVVFKLEEMLQEVYSEHRRRSVVAGQGDVCYSEEELMEAEHLTEPDEALTVGRQFHAFALRPQAQTE